jgi:hypothetical protein
MFRRIWVKIKELWSKMLRRDPEYTENDVTANILHQLFRRAQKGRVNIYNGTREGLNQALGDHRSIVYIVELTAEPPRRQILNFKKYTDKLKSLWTKKV